MRHFNNDNTDYIKSNNTLKLPVKSLASSYRTNIINAVRNTANHRAKLGQALIDYIADKLDIASVKLNVIDKPLPHKTTDKGTFGGGKWGHYRHIGNKGIEISIWNKTAMKGQVVSNKHFYTTLIHEISHMIDCQKLGIISSPHTKGFYIRISELDKLMM